MSTAPATAPEKSEFTASIDVFARSGATLLLVMYGVGFVILSAYEAQYGVVQFGPLRGRIFLVGFAFLGLSTLPIVAHHYNLAYFGQLKTVLENEDQTLQSERSAVLAFGFIFTAYLMSLTFNFFLFTEKRTWPSHFSARYSWIPFAAWIAAQLAFLFIHRWIAKSFTRHPKRSVILAMLAFLILLGASFWSSPEELTGLTLWFWVAAMFGRAGGVLRSREERVLYVLDYRTWFAVVLSVSVYVTLVVGHMQQKFGGGAPVPVVMYLNKALPLANGAMTAEFSLLDETEEGYYVLPSSNKKALFIPRAEVSSIYFGPAQDLSKAP
jgi:hypothetical protein